MKTIEVDDELYSYIASHTKHIGERIRHFTAYVEIYRRITACCSGDERVRVASPAIVEAKPVKTIKDKVRAIRELLLSDEYAEQKSERSIALCCCCLHYILLTPRRLPKQRNRCTVVTRLLAADEQTLLKNGNQTKPKHVPGTPYWVITNTNTGRKCSMIEHIMQSMQFPAELIEKVCGTI